jgi:hypothetical protein
MGDSLALFAASRTTSRYLHQPHNGDYGPNSFQHGKGKHAFVLCEECAGCSQYTPHQVQKLVVDGGAARVALKMGWQEGPSRGKGNEDIGKKNASRSDRTDNDIRRVVNERHLGHNFTKARKSENLSVDSVLKLNFKLNFKLKFKVEEEKKKKTPTRLRAACQNTTKKQAALRLFVCVCGCFNG